MTADGDDSGDGDNLARRVCVPAHVRALGVFSLMKPACIEV
jgi:hypothetical protein